MLWRGNRGPDRLPNGPKVMLFTQKIETHSWIVKSVWNRLTKKKKREDSNYKNEE